MEKNFLESIEAHKGIIYKACRMYCSDEEDCNDLYQDIVAQLWKSWGSFRGDSKVSTWIYRIAFNTAISGFRKKKRSPERVEVSSDELNIAQEDIVSKKEAIETLHYAISKLTDVEKAMILLYLEEEPYEEIAGIMGITQNNVRVKMLRIREKLRKFMEDL